VAGGESTRLPGKLARRFGGIPLLARVAQATAPGREAVIAAREPLDEALLSQVALPLVFDRPGGRGPLAGLLAACSHLSTPLVFAVGGDMPGVTADLIDRLAQAWQSGDEALVPVGPDGRLEPLAALYDRAAVLREGPRLFAEGGASMMALLDRLHARPYPMANTHAFVNINTPQDEAAFRAAGEDPNQL
jgi:molybdopterin-guanine dinucleotide biosynthesis protein A